jgi:hypothetical protein
MYPTIITDQWIESDMPFSVLDAGAFSMGGNSKGGAAVAWFKPLLLSE